MGFSRSRFIRVVLTVVFFACMVVANFYVFRALTSLGMKIYFYDKLIVAYKFGGINGLKQELNQVLSSEKFPRELALARYFEVKLKDIRNPQVFLEKEIEEGKAQIIFLRRLRSSAIIIMFAIFLWQVIERYLQRRRTS